MTDTLFEQPSVPREDATPWAISFEVIAWIILLAAALVIRLAEIDTVPLSDREAAPAVTAWHMVHADAPGTPAPADSPILLWVQTVSFAVLGGTEFAARLPTVIAGLGLLLLAFSLRGRLGRDKAFLLALLLACSPIGITASRTSDSAVWAALFGGGFILAVWNFADDRRASNATWAGFLAAGLLLSGAGGIVLGIVLALSLILSAAWASWNNPQDLALEQPGQTPFDQISALRAAFPWQRAGLVFAGTLLALSTGFLIVPGGISHIGDVIGGFINGFWAPSVPQTPIGAALVMLLFFDPLLIVFAIIGVIVLMRQERFGMRERFLVAWAVIGALVAVFYRGSAAGAALWITLPLAVLAMEGIAECFIHRRTLLFNDFIDGDEEFSPDQYRGLKWLTATIVIALFLMMALHMQEVGRGLMLVQPGLSLGDTINYLRQPALSMMVYSAILLFVLMGFLIVGFFLAASIWGNANTLQGYGLGLMILMLVSGVGGGWKATSVHATVPGELWQPSAVSQSTALFRETLKDLALRQTRGYPMLTITIVTDIEKGLDPSGEVAWLVRDYPKTTFVNSLVEAKQQEIVITSPTEENKPDLGGTYVGQSFPLRTFWTIDDLSPVDALGWFTSRTLRADEARESNSMVMWVRSDVYTHSTAE